MNGKGFITWAAISAGIGVLTAWLSITQLVIEPLRGRLEVARENVIREMLRLDHAIYELDKRVRALEQRR